MSEKRFRNDEDLAVRGDTLAAPPARRRPEGEHDEGDVTAASRSFRALDRERQAQRSPQSPLSWLDTIQPRADAGTVQAKPADGAGPASDQTGILAAAQRGVAGSGQPLPHADRIQTAFGHPDVSHVHAHVGGEAATAAASMGASAYATGDRVAFAHQPDLHLAAHEAAHVVQQRSGVSLKGGVGQAGDAYECQADAVADRVVAGRPASDLLDTSLGSSGREASVQMFGSREHKGAGDAGAAERTYRIESLVLTHGDLVAIRGDYFEEDVLMDLWSKHSTNVGKLPGTSDEILYALRDALGAKDPRFAEGGQWAGIQFSDAVKQAVHRRYYRLAQDNTDHFVNPHGGKGELEPGGAPATYREGHERAIDQAYRDGAAGNRDKRAMITEAMAQHFLTDSFAAGHITTPRKRIIDHWRTMFPRFGDQFIAKLINDLTEALTREATGISAGIPESVIRGQVKSILADKLKVMPKTSMADIVSSVAHDYDNESGVWVVNDLGWRWRAFGDGKMLVNKEETSPSHADTVAMAVASGINDIQVAFEQGQHDRTTPLDREQVLDQVRQRTAAPAKPGNKYGPEQFMPRLDPLADQPDIQFAAKSLDDLWKLRIRENANETWGELLVTSARTGELNGTLAPVRDGLDERINPFGSGAGALANLLGPPGLVPLAHGYLYPQRAFDEKVLQRLRNTQDALAFLKELVNT